MPRDPFQAVHTKSEEAANRKIAGPEVTELEKPIKVFVKETAASSSTDERHKTHLLEEQIEVEDKLLGMDSDSEWPLMPVVSGK